MNQFKMMMFLIIFIAGTTIYAQEITVKSPDKNISVTINNGEKLTYSVTFNGKVIVNPSPLGFEFKDEPSMTGNFLILDQSIENIHENWIPVVNSKHSRVTDYCNELHLCLKEKSDQMRQMDLIIRAYNDGTAFRYRLSRAGKVGDRQIVKELTTFMFPVILKHGLLNMEVIHHQMKQSFLNIL